MSTDILITGGTGFIGSQLARQLATSGHRVTVIGRRSQSSSRMNSQDRNLTVLQDDLCDQQLLEKRWETLKLSFTRRLPMRL